jgi:hypothetical protein
MLENRSEFELDNENIDDDNIEKNKERQSLKKIYQKKKMSI